jgi:hypothetical protein
VTRASDVAKILKQPFTNTLGTSNYRAGVNAGDSIASGGNYNVAIGDEAGTALTTGDNNVAIGFEALNTEDANGLNVAVGFRSLKTLNAGGDGENTAVGNNTGLSMTTAFYNTVIGSQSGDALTDGSANTAVGYNTLSADTRGQNSTAVGRNALLAQNFTSSTDSYNVAMGRDAGLAITTGVNNTFIGSLAGDAQTDADNNTAVGYEALSTNTLGSASTAIGYRALKAQNYSSATDALNVAVGNAAGSAVTTGTKNVLIGNLTGDGITTGDRNTAVGYRTLSGSVDDGQYNTCVGSDAGLVTTGDQNTFVGAYDPSTGGSGAEVTSGSKNTILGAFNGNQSSLDIRTSSNQIVISDGDGTPAIVWDGSINNLAVNSYVAVSDGNFHSRFGGGQSANNNATGFAFFSCGTGNDRTGMYWENQGVLNSRLWVDDTGDLRIQGSNPTAHNSGTVVGSQSFTATHIYKTDETDLKIGEAVCLVGQKIVRAKDAKSKTCVGIYAGQSWKNQDSLGNACNEDDGWGHAVIAVGDTRFHQTDSETIGVLVDGSVSAGDLLCTSSTSGKLTVQDDDIIRSYTVGKAMESGNSSSPVYAYIYSG